MTANLVPWQSGKCWDVTVTCPLADSYVTAAAREAGLTAELAAQSCTLVGSIRGSGWVGSGRVGLGHKIIRFEWVGSGPVSKI